MANKKKFPVLQHEHISGKGYITIPFNEQLPQHIDHKLLAKVFKSPELQYKSSLLGSVAFENSLQYLYTADSSRRLYSLAKHNLPVTALYISPLVCNQEEIPEGLNINYSDDCKEIEWLMRMFPLYGFKRYFTSNAKDIKKLSEKNTDLIADFIKNCCTGSVDSQIYADELYEYYVKYIDQVYGIEPLSPILFNKELKSKPQYRYYRPHHSRDESNRYAYLGLDINMKKWNKVMTGDNPHGEDRLLEIQGYLQQITQDMNQIL